MTWLTGWRNELTSLIPNAEREVNLFAKDSRHSRAPAATEVFSMREER